MSEQGYPVFKVYLLLFFGMAAFGFAPILVKTGIQFSALGMASLRTCFAFCMILPFWLFRKKELKASGETIPKLTGLEIIAGISLGLHFILWISSLYYTSVASASVLVTTHPIILIIAERLLNNQHFISRVWAGVLLAFSGSILLGFSDRHLGDFASNPVLGNILSFSAAVVFAMYFMLGRKVRQNRTWLQYTFRIYGFAALSCAVALVIFEGFSTELFHPTLLLVALGLAVGPQILGHGSLNYAVKYISPTLLSTLILAEPLIASGLAVVIYGEIPPVFSIISMLIILGGIALTWSKGRKSTSAKAGNR